MLTVKHFARMYPAKCDCCKRVTGVQDKIEITMGELLLGELSICMQCLPAVIEERPHAIVPAQTPEEQAEAEILAEVNQKADDESVREISEAEYDDLLANANEVVDLFG